MGITWVPMIAQAIGTLVHVGWCHLFTVKLDMGVKGLGYATSITYSTMFLVITVNTVLIKQIKYCISWPTLDSFREWGPYFRLSIPATLMLCAEWWSFELMTILAGVLGVIEQATIVISFNVIA